MTGSLLVRPEADETGVATNAGVRITWRRYGDGPETILFIPTWNFVDSRVLRHQVDGLRDRFRVLTYDARGSGDSDHPATGYGFQDHVGDAIAVLDATGTEAAGVVGASTGTHIAVLLACSRPARVKRLVLVAPNMDVPAETGPDPGAAAEPPAEVSAPEPDWRTEYPAFVAWFIAEVFPEPDAETTIAEIVEIALQADHGMLEQQAGEMDWDDAPSHLAEIGCPALVLNGTSDSTLDIRSMKTIADAIPDGNLILLDGLGHRPDISRPDLVNPILADFLAPSGD